MEIPAEFCWTRYGTESGEAISSIFERKERERRANDGVFLWGIGTSIRPALCELVKHIARPTVIFSPMLSRPAMRDILPPAICCWTSATGLDGEWFDLPSSSLVTSAVRAESPPKAHYALVCSSEVPIDRDDGTGTINVASLRNWANGTMIGSSQVTCVVRRVEPSLDAGATYRAAVVARLCPPYFVRLSDPSIVPDNLRLDRLEGPDWLTAVQALTTSGRRGRAHWRQDRLAV
jgi:hypothetical protein